LLEAILLRVCAVEIESMLFEERETQPEAVADANHLIHLSNYQNLLQYCSIIAKKKAKYIGD
jgi:hypothetical protein